MDVSDQMGEVGIGGYPDAAKGTLEQRSSAITGLVESLGVGVEQVREVLTGFLQT